MPKTIHGKPIDEAAWSEAERAIGDEYDKEKEPGKYYGTLMKIYNNIVTKKRKKR